MREEAALREAVLQEATLREAVRQEADLQEVVQLVARQELIGQEDGIIRSSTPIPIGEDELGQIVTTRSQVVPDTNWRHNLNTSIVDDALNHQGSLDDYDCAVCGQTIPTLASLQAHLLARHCSQSDTVLRLVREMQEQLKEIQTSHYSLVSDVKIVKDNMQIKQSPPPLWEK